MTTGQTCGVRMEIQAGKMLMALEVHTTRKQVVTKRSIQMGGKIPIAMMDQGHT